MLVECETRPGVTVENLQQVRAAYDQQNERWKLHLVCKDGIRTPTAPRDETAGIDLGISNFAARTWALDNELMTAGCTDLSYPVYACPTTDMNRNSHS
jgi:putative transposase